MIKILTIIMITSYWIQVVFLTLASVLRGYLEQDLRVAAVGALYAAANYLVFLA